MLPNKPMEGALFRMSLRHFIQAEGYTRDAAKRFVDELKWADAVEKIKKHGPNMLSIFRSFDLSFLGTPGFIEQVAVDISTFDIDLPNWQEVIKLTGEPN